MQQNLDLNIDNYSANEILSLFNVNADLQHNDIKNAYKTTLMTHPDKTGLDKKYFLFFTKAFKKLKYLYEYNNKLKLQNKNTNTTYSPDDFEDEKYKLNVESNSFNNKKFNKFFEKAKIHDEEQDSNYDEWIKSTSNEVVDTSRPSNMSGVHKRIQEKKKELKSIVEHEDFKEMNPSGAIENSTSLRRNKPKYYESGLFSKMQYEDYKRAHTETVIPVDEEDLKSRKQFRNVNELQNYRSQNMSIPDKQESARILQEKKRLEQEDNISIAYDLSKQMEQIKKSNQIFKSNYNLIMND